MRIALWLVAPAIVFGQTSFSEIEARISDFTLPNGMKFIVCERNIAPVVSFRTYADVGALQDPPHLTGLAHMFEHMAFKGTSTLGTTNYAKEKLALDQVDAAFFALRDARKKGEKADPAKLAELEAAFRIAQEEADTYADPPRALSAGISAYTSTIEAAGGRGVNARTSHEGTVFYYDLPANAIELWFMLESQRFTDPVFREFYKERSVVMQERRLRLEDNSIGKVIQETLTTAFRVHPYGRPVIGDWSDLENLTRADAITFFQKYYGASNLTAVIVGNVTPAAVKRLAETYFGPLPASPKPAPIKSVEPPQTSERSTTLHFTGQSMLCMAYHRPDMKDSDAPAYEVLVGLLTQGRSARFTRSLIDRGIVSGLRGQVTYPGGKYPNLLFFSFNPTPGHSNDSVADAVVEEFERIKANGVTEEEISGAKARFRASFLYQLKDNAVVTGQLAGWQVTTGSWHNLFRYLEGVAAVKAEDIQRVARKTLNRENLTIGKVEPPVEGPTK